MTIRRHPLRDSFSWAGHGGPLRAISADQAAHYDAEGHLLLKGVLSRDVTAALEAAIDPFEQRMAEIARGREPDPDAVQISRPDEINFVDHLAVIDPVVRSFTMLPSLVGVAVDLLGPDLRLYQEHAVYKKAQTTRSLPWHQDGGYEFTLPYHYVTFWIPLTEATVDNGCVWVLPGVHRHGPLDHWPEPTGYVCHSEEERGHPVEASVGDALVFSSLTPHRSGPNLTDSVRKAYVIHYALEGMSWVESMEHQGYERRTCNDPRRQYVVAAEGRPLAGDPVRVA